MRSTYLTAALAFALIGGAVAPPAADAQVRDRIRDRARQQLERRAVDAVDRAFEAVECAVTDRDCIRGAHADGSDVVLVDGAGNPIPRENYPADALRPGEGVWLNYDFVPGERLLFAEDFTGDRVGDFPRRFELVRGNVEVADWNGARWLRASTDSRVAIPLPEVLPERFTIELELHGVGRTGHAIHFSEARDASRVEFHPQRGGVAGGPVRAIGNAGGADADGIRSVRVMADGSYMKVYLDETRVANVPNAEIERSDRITLAITAMASRPVLIGNVRIAAGTRPLYDAIAADGRVTTRGILFDTGSDRIRPESTPTLEEIAAMLREHAALELRIEGHTDSVGNAEANRSLSERRAAAVLRYLVAEHDIDVARLEAAGFGEQRPVDDNDTPEGRQNNRRVELVRR